MGVRKFGVQSSESGVQSSESGVGSSESGVQSSESCHSERSEESQRLQLPDG